MRGELRKPAWTNRPQEICAFGPSNRGKTKRSKRGIMRNNETEGEEGESFFFIS